MSINYQQAVDEAWAVEEAAYRRYNASPTNLHLRMKYEEAAHKRQEAKQALEDNLPECDYCPSKLYTEQEQNKRLCRWCQLS